MPVTATEARRTVREATAAGRAVDVVVDGQVLTGTPRWFAPRSRECLELLLFAASRDGQPTGSCMPIHLTTAHSVTVSDEPSNPTVPTRSGGFGAGVAEPGWRYGDGTE